MEGVVQVRKKRVTIPISWISMLMVVSDVAPSGYHRGPPNEWHANG